MIDYSRLEWAIGHLERQYRNYQRIDGRSESFPCGLGTDYDSWPPRKDSI